MKIGIVTSSVREGRQSIEVANWTLAQAQKLNSSFTYEIIDLKEYDLPIMGAAATAEQGAAIGNWAAKIEEMDGFIFVTAEYNHAPTGVFKNALDYLKVQFTNKAIAFVGYGGVGGSRAIEHLRLIVAEYGAASVQKTVNFMLAFDFENFATFKPMPYHEQVIPELFAQLEAWSTALKTIR